MRGETQLRQSGDGLGSTSHPVSQKSLRVKRIAVDFTAGMVTGWVSVLLLQPLDMIKTTMQSSSRRLTIVGCAKEIYQKKKMKGFYRGMLFPLMGSSFFSALYYGSNEQYKKLILTNNKDKSEIPLIGIFLSGSLAGLTTSMVSIPSEHIKIRLQTQQMNQYSGSIDCLIKIFRQRGFAGLYKSASLQLGRDFIGCGSFFTMYDVMKRKMKERSVTGELNKIELFGCGCVAGLSYWPLCFPLDVMKTRMQSDSFSEPKFSSIRECATAIYRGSERTSLRNFYKGFLISNLRSIPNSALCLFSFEHIITFLQKLFQLPPNH